MKKLIMTFIMMFIGYFGVLVYYTILELETALSQPNPSKTAIIVASLVVLGILLFCILYELSHRAVLKRREQVDCNKSSSLSAHTTNPLTDVTKEDAE